MHLVVVRPPIAAAVYNMDFVQEFIVCADERHEHAHEPGIGLTRRDRILDWV